MRLKVVPRPQCKPAPPHPAPHGPPYPLRTILHGGGDREDHNPGPRTNCRWRRARGRRTVVAMAQTALITGASRGLGLALARGLAERGWRLVIDARGADALEEARAELSAQTDVTAIAGDVADAAHRDALLDAAGGGLNLLVNNASVLG